LGIQKSLLGVGKCNVRGNVAVYNVLKLKDIINIVIPHFIKYPLASQKKADFI